MSSTKRNELHDKNCCCYCLCFQVCDNLFNGSFPDEQEAVQKVVADVEMYSNLIKQVNFLSKEIGYLKPTGDMGNIRKVDFVFGSICSIMSSVTRIPI